MRQIKLYRRFLWPIAAATCVLVVLVCLIYSYLSPTKQLSELLSIPFILLLPLILGTFLYGVRRIHKALGDYQAESEACGVVSDAISTPGTPGEIQAWVAPVTKGGTAIGKRVAQSLESADVNTASSLMQLPQPMDVEEDKTFGELHFWRSALVLLGLLSTVVFFALAFNKRMGGEMRELAPLINDLQTALTMTMAGIVTSVVLGLMSTRLFDIQQDLKLRVEELTALMLPRLLPQYEKGTKEEPGPALMLEKLQDFFREVEDWRSGIGADVERLAEVLVNHREMIAGLPAVSLPKGFGALNTTLSQVSTTMTETRGTIERALQLLSESRDLDLNNVVSLLSEIRTDSERIKVSQTKLLEQVLPKQVQALEGLNKLNATLEKVGAGLELNAKAQKALTETNASIQKELARLNQPRDEELVGKMEEVVAAIKNLHAETARANMVTRSSGTLRPAPAATASAESHAPPHRRPPTTTTAAPPAVRKPPAPGTAFTAPERSNGGSRWGRVRDWFSDLFQS